jgi:hypothetical protein
MKSTAMALVVALAAFTAPAAMARTHGAHSHHTGLHVTRTVRGPGYAGAYPVGRGYGAYPVSPGYAGPHSAGPTWGSECMTDEGGGRYFPCDGLP